MFLSIKENPSDAFGIILKKYFIHILIIAFVVIASVIWTINFLFKKHSPPSKAAEPALNISIMVKNSMVITGGRDGYAYAPSIIKVNGVYHAVYCSTGGVFPSVNQGTDYMRYSSSTDGVIWTKPRIIIKPPGPSGDDYSACDPSLVYFNGFYYMYYGGASWKTGFIGKTVIHVARALNPAGPYEIYTRNNTWKPATSNPPPNPKDIIEPFRTPEQTGSSHYYGAGQPTVIVHPDEANNNTPTLYMWYTDDSNPSNTNHDGRTYFIKSTDPVLWNTATETNIPGAHTTDTKWDGINNRYISISIGGYSAAHVAASFSTDGIHWSGDAIIPGYGQPNNFPSGIGNPGFSSDREGIIIPNEPILLSFEAYPNFLSTPSPKYAKDLYVMPIPYTSILTLNPSIYTGPIGPSSIGGHIFNVSNDQPLCTQITQYPKINGIKTILHGLDNSYYSETYSDNQISGSYPPTFTDSGYYYFLSLPLGSYQICINTEGYNLYPYCTDAVSPASIINNNCVNFSVTTPANLSLNFAVTTSAISPTPSATDTSTPTPAPSTTNPPPKGVIDNIVCSNNQYIISGWACDTSMPTAALRVDFYSNGTLIKGDAAYRQREPAVGQQCGGNSSHGYTTTLPLLIEGHSVSAYAIGIDSSGQLDGNNVLIGQQFATACSSDNPATSPRPLTSGSPLKK